MRFASSIVASFARRAGHSCRLHDAAHRPPFVTNRTPRDRGLGTFRHVEGPRRPLELILARNLLASLSTPAFLVDAEGEIAFYNDAAGTLLGRRYEDRGPMPAEEWTQTFGPLDAQGRPRPFTDLPLTRALRRNRPAHDRFAIRPLDGGKRDIEASGLPILGAGGYRGAIIVFWPADEEHP